jgi:hypothetical protein
MGKFNFLKKWAHKDTETGGGLRQIVFKGIGQNSKILCPTNHQDRYLSTLMIDL